MNNPDAPEKPKSHPGVGSSALLACLRRMRVSVQTRITFYQQKADDPYQINTALMVAMLELDGMIAEQIEYLGKQANSILADTPNEPTPRK